MSRDSTVGFVLGVLACTAFALVGVPWWGLVWLAPLAVVGRLVYEWGAE